MAEHWVRLSDGAMDSDRFKAYTAEILAPMLAPGDIVVMDNLPAHKVAGIAERLRQLFPSGGMATLNVKIF